MHFHHFKIISPWKGQSPSFEQTWILLTQRCFVPSLIEICPVILRRRFLKFANAFSPFRNYLPLEKGRALHLKNLNSLHSRMICATFGWNWSSGFGEDDFSNSSLYFHNFVTIYPWKRAEPFFETNLNSLYPKMHCYKFGWNWPSGSGEEDFLNFVNFFAFS